MCEFRSSNTFYTIHTCGYVGHSSPFYVLVLYVVPKHICVKYEGLRLTIQGDKEKDKMATIYEIWVILTKYFICLY